MDEADELPLVFTVSEVSRMLRCGRNTAYELIRRGELRSVRVGRSIRVPRNALLEFLAQAPNAASSTDWGDSVS